MAKIYFLNHPANEPGYPSRKIGSPNSFTWNNRGKHWRKFINRNGQYLDHAGNLINDKLYFWGEYEPYSDSIYVQKRRPYAVHSNLKPVIVLLPMPHGALNTDPYVYGYFRNICCRRKGHKYQKDDVLVFGEMDIVKNTIEIDTVIVVEDFGDVSKLNKQGQYYLAAVKPLKNPPIDYVEGLKYNGKSYFSFVPCLPASRVNINGIQKHIVAASRFTKPLLNLNLFGTRVFRTSPYKGKECAPVPFQPIMWNMILNEVHNKGLELGVNIQLIGKANQQ